MRIKFLDGLRGGAILLVLAFHAYARWPDLLPYGNAYKSFPLFEFGWLGVQLFFLISGFVIFMTLDKTESFQKFIYNRWTRLFPAMFLVSILIYITAPIFSERPGGKPEILSLLPALTFIEPKWWEGVVGTKVGVLEGAFWTIYVEFKFYLIAGLVYFYLGRRYLVPLLLLFFSVSIFTSSDFFDTLLFFEIVRKISLTFSFQFFGWFASGAIFYLYYQNKEEVKFWLALIVALTSSFFVKEFNVFSLAQFAAAVVAIIFALSLRLFFIQEVLQSRFLLFFGFISYPLYLIHENIMVATIIKLPSYFPWMPDFIYPLVPVAFLTIFSYLIAVRFEPLLRKQIKWLVGRLAKARI